MDRTETSLVLTVIIALVYLTEWYAKRLWTRTTDGPTSPVGIVTLWGGVSLRSADLAPAIRKGETCQASRFAGDGLRPSVA
jgi:hypothetical protein